MANPKKSSHRDVAKALWLFGASLSSLAVPFYMRSFVGLSVFLFWSGVVTAWVGVMFFFKGKE